MAVASPPSDGAFVRLDDGRVYRMAGGAPIHVASWSVFGGEQACTVVTQQQFNAFASVPVDGTFVRTTGDNNVYRIAGGAPIYVSNWNVFGGPQPSVDIDPWAMRNITNPDAHMRAVPADGTFVVAAGDGRVFRVAGGAPIYVNSWDAFGGPQDVVDIDPWALKHLTDPRAHMRAVPADGTVVGTKQDGKAYRIAGGAPIYIADWSAVGGVQPLVLIDQWAVDHTTHPDAHLRPVPADGTYLTTNQDGRIYRIAGGAPLHVSSWTALRGPYPTVLIDQWAVDNVTNPDAHLNPVPADGTFVATPDNRVYRIVGGAPVHIDSWTAFGGQQPFVAIDQWPLDNLSNPRAHMNPVPADGTFARTIEDARVYRFAGGAPLHVGDWVPFGGEQPCVKIDRWAIDNASSPYAHMNPMPADGTIVSTLQDGQMYRFAGGAPIPVHDPAVFGTSQPPVGIDQAAIDDIASAGTHMNAVPADGTLVITVPDGRIYRFAGGAPISVKPWNAGGPAPPAVAIDQWAVDNISDPRAHMNATPADGTFIRVHPDGDVYRFAGGAPLHVARWDVLGGEQPSVEIDRWALDNITSPHAHMNAFPADGTFITDVERRGIYRIAGGAPIRLTHWEVVGGEQPSVDIGQSAFAVTGPYAHLRAVPADGTFVNTIQDGRVYRIAGGAPIYVSDWDAVGGVRPYVDIDQWSVDHLGDVWAHMNAVPADGTLVTARDGVGYRIAGGAPIPLASETAPPGSQPPVIIDPWVLANLSSPMAHLNARPAEGTVLLSHPSRRLYRVVGGAPVRVLDWFGLGQPRYVEVDDAIIDQTSDPGVHLNSVPADGAFLRTNDDQIYRIAGGAPIGVANIAALGRSLLWVVIDQWALENLGNPLAHMNAVPADGTFVRNLQDGTVFRIAGGAPMRIVDVTVLGAPPPCVDIDMWALDNTGDPRAHLRDVPADGTLLEGLPSGDHWEVRAGQRTPVAPTPAAIGVSDEAVESIPLAS